MRVRWPGRRKTEQTETLRARDAEKTSSKKPPENRVGEYGSGNDAAGDDVCGKTMPSPGESELQIHPTNPINPINQTDQTDQTDKTNQTSRTDKTDKTDKTDEIRLTEHTDRTNSPDKIGPPECSDRVNSPDGIRPQEYTDRANPPDGIRPQEYTDRANSPDGRRPTDRTNLISPANPANPANQTNPIDRRGQSRQNAETAMVYGILWVWTDAEAGWMKWRKWPFCTKNFVIGPYYWTEKTGKA